MRRNMVRKLYIELLSRGIREWPFSVMKTYKVSDLKAHRPVICEFPNKDGTISLQYIVTVMFTKEWSADVSNSVHINLVKDIGIKDE